MDNNKESSPERFLLQIILTNISQTSNNMKKKSYEYFYAITSTLWIKKRTFASRIFFSLELFVLNNISRRIY